MAGNLRSSMEALGQACSIRQLLRVGHPRKEIYRAVRSGMLHRVRRDAVVLASALDGATPWERRYLETMAVAASLAPVTSAPGGVPSHALSHVSALVAHGLPYLDQDPLVHLVRTDGRRGRRDETVFVHRPVDRSWLVTVDAVVTVDPVLAAVQTAALDGPEAGLVAVDGVLRAARERDLARRSGGDESEHARTSRLLHRALDEHLGNGRRHARTAVEFADGRSESAGESRARWLVHLLGFGVIPQVEVRDPQGLFVARVDLMVEGHRVVIEFDGSGKYDDRRALVAEKHREDRLRRLGYEVVRLTWADLARPRFVRHQVLAAVERARQRAA